MRLVHLVTLLIGAVAVAIGVIGKVQPEIFLQLPFGFLLWAITGNPMPPYFDDTCLLKENWKGQRGDIVLSSGAKAGTLWVQTVIFLLRSNGWDGFDELRDYFDSCEYKDHPYHSMEERQNETARKRAIAQGKGFHGFQVFTHKFPREDSKLIGVDPQSNPEIKYIAVVRNGKEVLKSFLPFINAHTEKFRTMWGGFPPKDNTPESILKLVLDDADFYFGHILAWWKRKDLPNVLLLHYANLKRDPVHVIRRMAEFLEIELTPQLLAQVLHKSSLDYMTHPSRTNKYTGFVGHPNDRFAAVQEGAHVRAGGGKADGGVGFFTDEMTRQWEEAVQRHFGHDPALVEFANRGVVAVVARESVEEISEERLETSMD